MTAGVKYIAYGNSGGYALAAIAYARALHNAGVPVWWQPWFLGPNPAMWRPEQGMECLPLAHAAAGDAALADLPALIRAISRPIGYDTVVVHTVPEHWPRFIEPGKRCVGYSAWETDALPAHWPALLNAMDALVVPSRMNAEIFKRGGVRRPVHVVPHIRRHAWSESAHDDAIALRLRLRIPDDHFVFYSIGVWDPRKALGDLLTTYLRTFGNGGRVTLLLKTSAGVSNAADTRDTPSAGSAARAIARTAQSDAGQGLANWAVMAADDMSGRTIDAVHALGDCFVSLTHGEGWGLGSFDAAAAGKPVLITGWGGQLDYLGAGYPGLIDYRLVGVTGWSPHSSYQPTQRWAAADPEHAAQLMRAARAREPGLWAAAAMTRETIANRYAEPAVVRNLIAACHG